MNIKMIKLGFVFLFIIAGCNRENPTISDPSDEFTYTELKGYISGTLSSNDSPYYITEDIFVDTFQTLVIDPGVELHINKSKKIYIYGNMNATGEKEKLISFSAYNDTSWGGIQILNSVLSEFKFCLIEKINVEDDSAGDGSIKIINSNFHINNCIIKGNRSNHGGGLYVHGSSGNIKNSIFKDNFSVVAGGAILAEISQMEIVNNTFHNNSSFNYGGGIVLVNNERNFIQNNIFYKNTSRTGDPRIEIFPNTAFSDTAFNFLAYGNLSPNFVTENDFHLKAGSPCINNGNPDSSYNDYDGSRNDQGTYGGPLGNW